MRLQLAVERHGLPTVRVLWTVGASDAAAKGPQSGLTVSKFLEQVNEIVPLEAEHWGLEDYAVEVGGFECLHFSELKSVLKEDDIVHIRALQTSDIRSRRFSGRHQVTQDGRHLIDGIAFGRPYLKRPSRPEVRIPARRRVRSEYEDYDAQDSDESYVDGIEAPQARRRLTAPGDDPSQDDWDMDGIDDEDDDFVPDDEKDTDLRAELDFLQDDLQSQGLEVESSDSTHKGGVRTRSQRRSAGLGLEIPYYGPYHNPLLDQYYDDEPPSAFAKDERDERPAKRRKKSTVSEKASSGKTRDSTAVTRRTSGVSSKSVRFDDEDVATPATIRLSDGSDDDDDDSDFDPSQADESDKENTQPRGTPTNGNEETSSTSSDSSDSESSDMTDEEESSSSSSPGSISVIHTKAGPSTATENKKCKTKTADPKDLRSSAESQAFPTGEKHVEVTSKLRKSLPNGFNANTSATREASRPPGAGKANTKERNKRKKASRKLKALKARGILDEDATIATLTERKQSILEATNRKQGISDFQDNLEAQRQTLLDAINSGGIEVGVLASPATGSQDRRHSAEAQQVEAGARDSAGKETNIQIRASESSGTENVQHIVPEDLSRSMNEIPDSYAEEANALKANQAELEAEQAPTILASEQQGQDASHSTQQRRTRLDLASSRRMLFGSLGLKTPKTKADETALREKLAKDIRPIHQPRESESYDDLQSSRIVNNENDEDNDSWRHNINLQAVECCHDGITLSTPPFPFYQRWDPQQQRGHDASGSKKNKKGKKRKRGAPVAEDLELTNGPYDLERAQESNQTSSKGSITDPSHLDAQPRSGLPDDTHGDSLLNSLRAEEQLKKETGDSVKQTSSVQQNADMPSLPSDLSAFPLLAKDDSRIGAVIAFKRLLMSAETNWQPGISDHISATVDRLEADGTLVVTLAQKDNPVPSAHFDEVTGKRIYSKFEMPGYDESEPADDYNKLEIKFDELIEPVLIHPAMPEQVAAEPDAADASSMTFEPVVNQSNDTSHELHEDQARAQSPGVSAQDPTSGQEIFDIIKDAGWKSSIGSEAQKPLDFAVPDEPQADKTHEDSGEKVYWTSTPDWTPQPSANKEANKTNPASDTDQQACEEISIPPEGAEDSSQLDHDHKFKYPSLDGSNADESDAPRNATRQRRPVLSDSTVSLAQNGFVSPPSFRNRLRSGGGKAISSSPPFAPTSFDPEDEFPELSPEPFHVPASEDPSYQEWFSPDQSVNSTPSMTPKKVTKSETRALRRSTAANRKAASLVKEEEASQASAITFPPSGSQFPQVIDLTQSSDPMEPMEPFQDENDSGFYLDSSLGWVEKPKANKNIGVATETRSRRKTRSR